MPTAFGASVKRKGRHAQMAESNKASPTIVGSHDRPHRAPCSAVPPTLT